MSNLVNMLSVSAGAIVGALFRYQVSLLLANRSDFPWATFLVQFAVQVSGELDW
jgi:fluoride ion exporter CrcB/FEX